MDMGHIISASFSLYRRNLKFIIPHAVEYLLDIVAFGIFLIVAVIIIGLSLQSTSIYGLISSLQGANTFQLIAVLLFGALTFMFLSLFLNALARGAVINMAVEGYRSDRVSLSSAWEGARRYGVDIFGYLLILGCFSVGLFLLSILPLLLNHLGIFIFLVIFLAIIFTVVYVLTIFTPQTITVKGEGIIRGISESIKFVTAYKLEVLIYIALAAVIVILMTFISFLFSIPGILFAHVNEWLYMLSRVFQNIMAGIIGLIVAPYLEIVKTYMILEGGAYEDKSKGLL
jgi:hypothetical protein